MSELYGQQQRNLQRRFDTVSMADRVRDAIVQPVMAGEHQAFIESRDMFFLTTVDHRGFPTCSYKGGNPGFVKVLDDRTLAFPSLDGNGMYLSMGNITGNSKIGMLFIDFETPHRVRVHGVASIDTEDPLLDQFQEAELVVRVTIEEVFVNCPRYIHRYQKLQASPYVPQPQCATPLPQWKRIDALQDALPERDRNIASELGGTITPEEYAALVMQGRA